MGGLFLGFLFCTFVYLSGFQPGSYTPPSPRSYLAISRDIFWQSQPREGGATGIEWVEDRDASKKPTIHRTATPLQQRTTLSKMPVVSLLRISSLSQCSHNYCCFTLSFSCHRFSEFSAAPKITLFSTTLLYG